MSSALLPDLAKLPILQDLEALLISGIPLLDARAPVEFAEGAFPTAHNLPLLNDAERAAIGTRYKQAGQEAAIELGLQQISGTIKTERVNAWQSFFEQHPNAALYCFRGGLRSKITQQWLYQQTGHLYPRVEGGYKALRRFVLEQLELMPTWLSPLVLSGRTGSGKTRLLAELPAVIDLEALANHRGSAFGHQVTPQPSLASFENALLTHLLQQRARGFHTLIFEDESRTIGSIHLPETLFHLLREAPLIILQTPDNERIAISFQAYVVDMLQAFIQHYQDQIQGLAAFEHYVWQSVGKIAKRLGGVRYAKVVELIKTAFAEQQEHGNLEKHRAWVAFLLLEYYDPMYDYQLAKKQQRVLFQGSAAQIKQFLQQLLA
ncbi:tRNA 2-selenouridine(34) synthase MnmH [Thiolinea disciformis]|uniref:tRNA 2-selenouridine(34) synthase MnmH n=1 Tax=Thiolinea disciformis TaxID=125614 RepID=UPI00035C5D0D|nr:tRNA 2-selenouridine(34) synthase MnmH [Thiolinea disciformis]